MCETPHTFKIFRRVREMTGEVVAERKAYRGYLAMQTETDLQCAIKMCRHAALITPRQSHKPALWQIF
jgi:hypothetical protein